MAIIGGNLPTRFSAISLKKLLKCVATLPLSKQTEYRQINLQLMTN